MSFRRLLFVLAISVIVIMLGLFGFSYAWYSYSNASTSFNTTTSNEINPGVDIIYAQTDTINILTGIPIKVEDIEKDASHTDFTVNANQSALASYVVKTEISLDNISIDPALKVSSFKYQLIETINGSSNEIASGTGYDIGLSTSKRLKTMTTISKGTTYYYTFRIWLQETNTVQNDLMGKAFSARIKVSSMITK